MNFKKHTLLIALAVMAALPVIAATLFASDVHDRQSSTSQGQTRTIQGVWRTVVTPNNCQGVPFPSLPGLFTFNEGGTMSEYGIGPGSSPALRSPGHGVWQREEGWQQYSFAFTFYRYDASGVFLGAQKIRATLELGASGNDFASRSDIEVFDANDALILTACATAVATRFE
jgi:hypothetical protein